MAAAVPPSLAERNVPDSTGASSNTTLGDVLLRLLANDGGAGEQLAGAFYGVVQAFAQVFESFDAAVRRVEGQVRAAVAAYVRQAREDRRVREALAASLLAAGWPPTHRLSRDAELRVLDAAADETVDLTAVVENEMRAVFEAGSAAHAFSSWADHPVLGRRWRILEAGLTAFDRGDLLCAVPTLMPQVEGFVADLMGHRGRMNHGTLKGYVRAIAEAEGRWIDAAELHPFVVQHFLEQFEHDTRGPRFGVSRHAVLHGGSVDYDTWEAAAKVIAMIDFIQLHVMFLGSPSSDVLHVPGCPALRRRSKRNRLGRVVYGRYGSAIMSGRRPCRRCLAEAAAAQDERDRPVAPVDPRD